MSSSHEEQRRPTSGAEEFVRKAMAQVDKAHRIQRTKQIVISVLAFAAAIWMAFQNGGPELQIECTILIILCLALALCTAKITSLINKNTRAVLQAIADLQGKS